MNGAVSENKVQTMIDKHAFECPGVERLEREIRALRGSIDNLTQYLLNRRDS